MFPWRCGECGIWSPGIEELLHALRKYGVCLEWQTHVLNLYSNYWWQFHLARPENLETHKYPIYTCSGPQLYAVITWTCIRLKKGELVVRWSEGQEYQACNPMVGCGFRRTVLRYLVWFLAYRKPHACLRLLSNVNNRLSKCMASMRWWKSQLVLTKINIWLSPSSCPACHPNFSSFFLKFLYRYRLKIKKYRKYYHVIFNLNIF